MKVNRKTIFLTMISLLLPLMFEAFLSTSVAAEVIRVPYDYETIQEAIDAASVGATIQVAAGTYYENLRVDKFVKLIGGDRETTIIDGNGTVVVWITADYVYFSGFTIRNGYPNSGVWVEDTSDSIFGNTIVGNKFVNNWISIYLSRSSHTVIEGNTIADCVYGIRLYSSEHNTVTENTISANIHYGYGIYMDGARFSCNYNEIYVNNFTNTRFGIKLISSSYNSIYKNNFINNVNQTSSDSSSVNTWDNGAEGNYWSDYEGVDQNGDGIGDTPHTINSYDVDYRPLMMPWGPFEVFQVVWEPVTYGVTVVRSFTTGGFVFHHSLMQISFKVTGPPGTVGFCDVSIPKQLLHADSWDIYVGGSGTLSLEVTQNEAYTFLYFTFESPYTTNEVQIVGTAVIGVLGDVNGDGAVDSTDLGLLGVAWGSKMGEPAYNWRMDFNADGVVDLDDMMLLALNWGYT